LVGKNVEAMELAACFGWLPIGQYRVRKPLNRLFGGLSDENE